MRKNIIKTIKGIGFAIDVERNYKITDFLDITFNLNNGTYRPYKKPNDLLLYINKSSNHPPEIINQLPKIINERSSRNSSNEEVFNSSKYQYEKALRDSGYTDFKLKFNKTSNNHTKRNRQRNIICFVLICFGTLFNLGFKKIYSLIHVNKKILINNAKYAIKYFLNIFT